MPGAEIFLLYRTLSASFSYVAGFDVKFCLEGLGLTIDDSFHGVV